MTMTDQQYDALLETADNIIDAIKAQHPDWKYSFPKAIDRGSYIEIVWEEGPYEWPFAFPFGGRLPLGEGYNYLVRDVSKGLANQGIEAGEHFDCQTHYSIGVYRSPAV